MALQFLIMLNIFEVMISVKYYKTNIISTWYRKKATFKKP